jgi:hypothetical protein
VAKWAAQRVTAVTLTDWLDPAFRFATTVGDFLAAVVAAFVARWAVGLLARRK